MNQTVNMTLDQIGLKAGTDKASSGHNYLHFYEKHLSHLRHEPIILVEAGIGGYEFSNKGGESLRMWDKYFTHPDRKIIGFDVYDKSGVISPGAQIYQIDQTDEQTLQGKFGGLGLDVFIDDASHINPLSIRTFEIMFPMLKPGGIYIWEDIHTSYWEPEYMGKMDRRPNRNYTNPTAVDFLQDLQTGMQVDTLEPEYRGPWDGHIEEMHFMRNTCVIIKRKQ
jgi:hypothetical protein